MTGIPFQRKILFFFLYHCLKQKKRRQLTTHLIAKSSESVVEKMSKMDCIYLEVLNQDVFPGNYRLF